MNRRLVGLLAALCLTSACKEEPVGQMEPIPRPRGMAAPPPEAPKPAAPAQPPVDPSKVVLRWKLGAPLAFEVKTTSGAAAPPPPPAASARGKKPRKGRAPPPAPAAAAPGGERTLTFVLNTGETGEPIFHIFPQAGGEEERGNMTERGFVMDGLAGQLRDLAVMVLELPLEPVGPGAKWKVTTTLVDTSALRGFVQKEASQKNEVTLTALTPGEGGEQVATLEYELFQSLSGAIRAGDAAPVHTNVEQLEGDGHDPGRAPDKGKGKSKSKTVAAPRRMRSAMLAGPRVPVSADVRVKGRGEFLVKAGHWRSWEATVTTHAQGAPLADLAEGERMVRLTPVEPVPAELLKRLAKK